MKNHSLQAELEAEFMHAYDEYADFLFRFAVQKIADREKAKDIIQDAFLRMWQYRIDGKEIENHKAFLFRTTRNLIIDHYRKHTSESLDKLQENGFNPSSRDHEQTIIDAEVKEILSKLSDLPDDHRDVVFLRYVEGLPPHEIAVIVGESVNVVSVRLNRAIKKLQELFHLS